jgi:protoporphyrinogen oxidase
MNLKKRHAEFIIIGAGIAGCSAAQELQSRGHDYVLLEKDAEPGGLTRSIQVGPGYFDYSGHYLHLARVSSPAKIPHAHQSDRDWQRIERHAACHVAGRFVPAPFQYNLFALPKQLRKACLQDYASRHVAGQPRNFKEYLLSGFGQSISELFLVPYNKKQLCIPLERLSVLSATRFFPVPDESKIRAGFIKSHEDTPTGYNSDFWFPKYGGIGLLAKGLARDLKNLMTQCPVERIEFEKRIVQTRFGSFKYKHLISSMPLKHLCQVGDDKELRRLAKELSHNHVLCINLLLGARLPSELEERQWIYFPEPEIPFYRLGIYSNLPGFYVPAGHSSVYIEVARGLMSRSPNLSSILNEVFVTLERLKWFKRKNCVVISANWINCAYVHFTHGREGIVGKIRDALAKHNVFLIGRYGLWEYLSMEDSILTGVEVLERIARGQHRDA